ncbi:hypothetical protein CYMTET_38009 [Cymbomonas tetramitiformis]|uniref:Tubulin--tyrosine ligase-like protein 5 n=1 Tax=Cymbomonas tetramitiformis TaxID=36881 RepID=A0AAE0CCR7_9CHLO|nr:hypothetical protein CYMTET_38009 [Cymbomonas tetramitiformis]
MASARKKRESTARATGTSSSATSASSTTGGISQRVMSARRETAKASAQAKPPLSKPRAAVVPKPTWLSEEPSSSTGASSSSSSAKTSIQATPVTTTSGATSTASPPVQDAVGAAALHLKNLLSEAIDDEPSEVSEEGSKKQAIVHVIPPPLPGLEPTAAFGYDEAKIEEHRLVPCKRPRMYVKLAGIASNAVKAAFKQAGFRRTKGNNWNALWAGALKGDEFHDMNRYQKVNHFPGTWELGRKDKLYRNIGRFRRKLGKEFDIVPRHYVLPREADEWKAEYERNEDYVYIMKPCSSSRGRGIRVLRTPADVPKDKDCLVQRYITNPSLINGYKYDMRLYVVVTCFDPLRVYLWRDGLTRFATELYSSDESTLRKRSMHLTNFTVNKTNTKFVANENADEDGVGSKWSIAALQRHFAEQGLSFDPVWEQVCDIVVKTMISVEPNVNTLSKMHVPHRNICYEVYGFDIVLDDKLRAWLLEVNTGPALQSPSPLDKRLKFKMVSDMLNLVGLVPYDRVQFEEQEDAKRQARLTGIGVKPEDKPTKREIRSIPQMDFSKIPLADLPVELKEMLAEESRCNMFQRVFPAQDAVRNEHYMQFFETQRYSNVLINEWLKQNAATGRSRGRAGPSGMQRPVTGILGEPILNTSLQDARNAADVSMLRSKEGSSSTQQTPRPFSREAREHAVAQTRS